MKLVETININGINFSIDHDAYDKLGLYLNALEKNFENEQGGNEIIFDIEARIAELFNERNSVVGYVITLSDVTKVIETLGTPEDIAGTEEDISDNENRKSQVSSEKPQKRLYRDPDQRYLGGVCSGLAAWLGISPIIIRIFFVVITFFYGMSLAVYFILWIIIPQAKTTAQKLKMHGEPVTVGNIEKNIRKNISDTSLKQSSGNFLYEVGEFIGKAFGVAGRIIAILLGISLICCGIGFAILLICLFFMQDLAFYHFVELDFLSFTELLKHTISQTSYSILLICTVLTTALFTFALLFWGLKLVIGFKVKYKMMHLALSIFFIGVIITAIITSVAQARDFAWNNAPVAETQTLQLNASDTLYLTLASSSLQLSNNPLEVYFDKDNQRFYGKPNLHFRKSDDGQTKLRLSRESQGENKRAARQYAENINYAVNVRDSLLIFDPYFTVTPQDKWKFQALDVTLYIPVGTMIVIDDTMREAWITGRFFRWCHGADCILIMTEKNGLQSVDN